MQSKVLHPRPAVGSVFGPVAAFMIAPTALFAQDCIETVWSEDVEGYVDGENIVTGQACYPNCPPGLRWESAGAYADAAFGNPGLSINVWGNRPAGGDDLVHTYHDLEIMWPGTWMIAADLYVPSGTTGESYFILLNQYSAEGVNWSTQVHIDGDAGVLESDFDGGTARIQFDLWRRLETVIDFDNDRQDIRYDGEVINLPGKSWTGFGSGGTLTLAALDLYGNDADPFYWDNVELCSIPPEGACCFRSDPCIDDIVRDDCESLQDDAVFQGIGSRCGSCPFYGPDGWEIDDLLTVAPPFRWEGDTCNDFPGIPFNPDCEFFPEDCSECDLSLSQDQAWSFAIPWTGTWTFSTCGASDFDTLIYAGTAACLGDLGFNDDCARLPGHDDSELAVELAARDRVAITLEGGPFPDCGQYTLSVGALCPEIVIGPDEETFGPCVDDDTDPENHGCNTDPNDPLSVPTFSAIECGRTFSGTVGNFASGARDRRDLDWFHMEILTTTRVALDAVGNYPQVVLYLAELNAQPGSGEDECTNAGHILASDTTPTCTDANGARAAAGVDLVVGPGLYSPVVSTAFVDPDLPAALGGVPCGSPYELTITCVACGTGDLNDDGAVTFADILLVLANWGSGGPAADANCDGVVSFQDLVVVLTTWS